MRQISFPIEKYCPVPALFMKRPRYFSFQFVVPVWRFLPQELPGLRVIRNEFPDIFRHLENSQHTGFCASAEIGIDSFLASRFLNRDRIRAENLKRHSKGTSPAEHAGYQARKADEHGVIESDHRVSH